MNVKNQLRDGLFFQNPVTVQLLGMCSVLAITTTLFNGLGMGVSVLVILTLANIIISLLRKIIPNNIRIACFIVVIAGFVTIVDLCLQAFLPSLSASLGLFIPLIVVNCIILGRAESFAYKNGPVASALDGVFQGLGYTMVLVIMCVVREFLGNGTFGGGILNGGNGIRILPEGIPALGMILPVGGFLTLACVIAAMQYILNKPKKGENKTEEVAK
ncbi:electron transport complex subunit RsxE [Flavonifractor hominis]|uniref:Ion-translocating oxidoreductase complex subunit E n=1 Tax=Flavonifractor hominis TaxID=3133178 RepID=A0ABV1ES55_9FIRM